MPGSDHRKQKNRVGAAHRFPWIVTAMERMVARKIERTRTARLANRTTQKLGDLNQTMNGFFRAAGIFGYDHRGFRSSQQIREFFDAFLIGTPPRRKTRN